MLPAGQLGHLAVLQQDARQQLPGASSAHHAWEQLEPEARSGIAVPGMRGHLAGYQPASPVLGASQGAAGTGCFPCREHDFPSRKTAALCRGQGLLLLSCIPTAALPSGFAGTETRAVASPDGSRDVPGAFAPGAGSSVVSGDTCSWFCHESKRSGAEQGLGRRKAALSLPCAVTAGSAPLAELCRGIWGVRRARGILCCAGGAVPRCDGCSCEPLCRQEPGLELPRRISLFCSHPYPRQVPGRHQLPSSVIHQGATDTWSGCSTSSRGGESAWAGHPEGPRQEARPVSLALGWAMLGEEQIQQGLWCLCFPFA